MNFLRPDSLGLGADESLGDPRCERLRAWERAELPETFPPAA